MKIIVITFSLAALALSGCASTEYTQYAKAQTDIATARHNADAEKYKAFAAIAGQGDATAKVAAVMAMAMGGGQTGPTQISAPQASQALQWASILVPGLTQVAGMRYQHLSNVTQSNNATALGMSTNNAFLGMAGQIQAPGSITTNTLSGTGTLGSGAYSTQDRHDVTTPAPVVIAPVVQVVPTVIEPTVITPVIAPGVAQ